MKGDFSRFTFDPRKHYSGVLHQQGRVWLDSDWNEEVLERLALLQQELTDVIGPSGVPEPGSGFQLTSSSSANAPDDFGISAGHCYVNGTLCQLEANTTYLSQPDLLDPPRIAIPADGTSLKAVVYLEVWQRLITYLEDDSIREIALGGPDTSARLKNIVQVKVITLPSGTGNITCSQAAQFLPTNGSGTLTTLQPTNVQPQNLCQLPDPANFTGRENHLYRVQVHDGGDVNGANTGSAFSVPLAANVSAGANSVKLSPALTAAQADAATRSGFITISDNTGASERVPLSFISADGITLTLGQPLNNAYRTTNSASVAGGIARFKWSRDNAAFAVAVSNVQADRKMLTLASLGRDVATALHQGDLVEISDDASDLGPARGHLTNLASDPDPDQFTVALADPIPNSFQVPGGSGSPPSTGNRHMVLRRWDGVGDASSSFADATTPGTDLGDGVHIQFGGQDLRPGDYWQFTARAADGSVQPLLKAPAAGINRFRAPLAVVSWGPPPPTSPPSSPPPGTVVMTVLANCLPIFPALIHFPPIDQGIHIIGLDSVDAGRNVTPLINDTDVQINTFAGINIQCDAPVDPASISRPTCFVMMEFPDSFSNVAQNDSYVPVILAGSVSTNGNVISWKAGPQAGTVLNQAMQRALDERGVLAHLILKGNFIWSQNDPTLFLDGEVFGRPPGANTSNVPLRLPSGDRRRGGNFDMWFWFVAAPSSVTNIQANPPGPISVGQTTTLTITFSSPAPPNSVVVITLSNSNVTVPSERPSSPPTSPPSSTATVSVPAGATSVPVIATGAAVGTTRIAAGFPAQTSPPAIALAVQDPVLVAPIVFDRSTVFVGDTAQGTITISAPASSQGVAVDIRTDPAGTFVGVSPALNQPPSAATSITVPAGSRTQNFVVTAIAPGRTTISATARTPNSPTISALFVVKQKLKEDKDKESSDEKRSRTVDKVAARDTKGVRVVEASARQPVVSMQVMTINAAAVQSHVFIRPDERPPVGDEVLNPRVAPRPAEQTTSAEAASILSAEDAKPDSGDALANEHKPSDKPVTAEKGVIGENLTDRFAQ